MNKLYINNRDGNQVCVVVEGETNRNKLAFVMHGLGGNKQLPHDRAMIEAFLENGYVVVSFDVVHTFGESKGGMYEDATVTNYYADFEDVVNWASTQAWYSEPFVLCGHSLGGMSVALYAEKHPEKVKALAPISLVVSGELSLKIHSMFPGLENLDEWKRDGIWVTKNDDGTIEKQLKWAYVEDRSKYSTLTEIDRLKMPVIVIVGEKDDRTPPVHQQIFYDKLPGKKEMHIIKNAQHSFNEPSEQEELKHLLLTWLHSLE